MFFSNALKTLSHFVSFYLYRAHISTVHPGESKCNSHTKLRSFGSVFFKSDILINVQNSSHDGWEPLHYHAARKKLMKTLLPDNTNNSYFILLQRRRFDSALYFQILGTLPYTSGKRQAILLIWFVYSIITCYFASYSDIQKHILFSISYHNFRQKNLLLSFIYS